MGRRSKKSSEKSRKKKGSSSEESKNQDNEKDQIADSTLQKSQYQEQMSRISEQCESQNSNNMLNRYTSKDTPKSITMQQNR